MRCARITGAIEQRVLRGMFPILRERAGMRSRHRDRDRPHQQVYRNVLTGAERTVPTPRDKAPFAAFGIFFPPPTVLTGEFLDWDSYLSILRPWIRASKGWGDAKPGEAIIGGEGNIEHFCRMLAKMAHCIAVVRMGPDAFQPLLPSLILGKTKESQSLVGGTVPRRGSEKFTRAFSIGRRLAFDDTHYWIVDIRLFAYLGAPQYRVVVGRVKSGGHEVPV
jgi:hypothetical protein